VLDLRNCSLRCSLTVVPVPAKDIGFPLLVYSLDVYWILLELNFDEFSILAICKNDAQNVSAVDIITLPLRASMVPSQEQSLCYLGSAHLRKGVRIRC
jgi:hypothetical protein